MKSLSSQACCNISRNLASKQILPLSVWIKINTTKWLLYIIYSITNTRKRVNYNRALKSKKHPQNLKVHQVNQSTQKVRNDLHFKKVLDLLLVETDKHHLSRQRSAIDDVLMIALKVKQTQNQSENEKIQMSSFNPIQKITIIYISTKISGLSSQI